MSVSGGSGEDEFPLPPTHAPQDGSIDFSRYTLEQLEELEHTLDRHAFPLNFSKLLAALAQRRQQQEQPEGKLFAGRFTARQGFRGWIEAKSKRCAVYGSGAIEIRPEIVVLAGWQRTWLGIPAQAEHAIPVEKIRNVVEDGVRVRFDHKGLLGWPRQVEFQAASAGGARALADLLPREQTAGFQKRWSELRDFNRRLSSAGHVAWVTPSLLLANVAMFAAMAVHARLLGGFPLQTFLDWGANYGPLTASGQWWRLVTALFVHGNLLHLLVNMWALWNAGRLAERLYGSKMLLFVYFVTGALASLTSIAWDPSRSSIGASGAIFGVMGSFLAFLAHPRTRVPAVILRAHWLSTLVFVLFNLIGGALQTGIDNAAHAGGLISGFALGWLLARPPGTEPPARFTLKHWLPATLFTAIAAFAALWQVDAIGGRLTIPERFVRNHAWFSTGETENLRRWQELSARAAAGSISDAELGQRFEKEILPFWKTADRRLQKEIPSLEPAQRPFASLLADYVRLRLQWTLALVDATEHNDANRAREAAKLAQQTNLALARIERIELRESMDDRPRALSDSPLVLHIRNLLSARHDKCVVGPTFLGVHRIAATDSATDGPASRAAVGCLAQRLFLTGEYSALDGLMSRYAAALDDLPDGGSRFSGVVSGLSTLFSYGNLDIRQALERTSDWRRSVKDSVNPDLVEAMVFESWAWTARGFGYANAVTPQNWALFAHRTEMAAESLHETAASAAASPLWYQLSLDVGLDQSLDPQKLRAIFDAGHARFPDYLPLYGRMLRILMPRWLGSYQKVDQFIEQMSANPRGGVDTEKYAELYSMYASLEGDSANIFVDGKADWRLMKGGLEGMTTRHPTSDVLLNAFARFSCVADDEVSYGELRPKLAKRLSASAWSDKYSLEKCDQAMAERYSAHASRLLDRHDFRGAVAQATAGLAIDPRADRALANRGMAYAWMRKSDLAEQDFDAAFAIDPHNPVVFRGRGVLASNARHYTQAVADFTASLKWDPDSAFALDERARAYAASGDGSRALADADQALRRRPDLIDMQELRASIFQKQGKVPEVIETADAIVATNQTDAGRWFVAGVLYASVGRNKEAIRAIGRAVTLAPSATAYLTRASYRPRTDIAGRRADIDAALKLAPRSASALAMLAAVQADAGQYREAIATLDAAMAIAGESSALLTDRGIVYARSGRRALADGDFSTARARSTSPQALNNMCWGMATAGVALETALADCNAAVAQAPRAPDIMDSRAFVLLRLGRYDDAIAAYDAALEMRPTLAISLYGRGIAKRRRGDRRGGDADIRSALSLNPGLGKEFTELDIRP